MGYKSDTVDDSLVEDYMTTTTITMNSKNNVSDIAKKMYAQNISSVPITDDEGEIVGILTERDIVKVIAHELQPHEVSAMNLMSFPAIKVKKNAPIEEAAKIMAAKKLRHLIVEDTYGTRTVGIITTSDLIRYLKKKSKTEDLLVSEVWELYF
jgi:signal-transduction protein with cAMP-binding, CBS, and nucleotidyltransferase domain